MVIDEIKDDEKGDPPVVNDYHQAADHDIIAVVTHHNPHRMEIVTRNQTHKIKLETLGPLRDHTKYLENMTLMQRRALLLPWIFPLLGATFDSTYMGSSSFFYIRDSDTLDTGGQRTFVGVNLGLALAQSVFLNGPESVDEMHEFIILAYFVLKIGNTPLTWPKYGLSATTERIIFAIALYLAGAITTAAYINALYFMRDLPDDLELDIGDKDIYWLKICHIIATGVAVTTLFTEGVGMYKAFRHLAGVGFYRTFIPTAEDEQLYKTNRARYLNNTFLATAVIIAILAAVENALEDKSTMDSIINPTTWYETLGVVMCAWPRLFCDYLFSGRIAIGAVNIFAQHLILNNWTRVDLAALTLCTFFSTMVEVPQSSLTIELLADPELGLPIPESWLPAVSLIFGIGVSMRDDLTQIITLYFIAYFLAYKADQLAVALFNYIAECWHGVDHEEILDIPENTPDPVVIKSMVTKRIQSSLTDYISGRSADDTYIQQARGPERYAYVDLEESPSLTKTPSSFFYDLLKFKNTPYLAKSSEATAVVANGTINGYGSVNGHSQEPQPPTDNEMTVYRR